MKKLCFTLALLFSASPVLASPTLIAGADFSTGGIGAGNSTTYDYRADENFYNTADNQFTVGTNTQWNNEWRVPAPPQNVMMFNGNDESADGAVLQLADVFTKAGMTYSGTFSGMSMCEACTNYAPSDTPPIMDIYATINYNSVLLASVQLTHFLQDIVFDFTAWDDGLLHLTAKNHNLLSYTNDGRIDHFDLYGEPDVTSIPTPEPPSLVLLGTMLILMALAARHLLPTRPRLT